MRLFGFFAQLIESLKSKVSGTSPYAASEAFLAQGDIFALTLVGPLADDEIRVLRTESGRHGVRVFQNEEPGRIYGYEDLIETVSHLPAEERLLPFPRGGNMLPEMVVVHGDLFEYFVMASQTCDVSGVDGQPKPFAAVLPVVSLASFLSREQVPIAVDGDPADDPSKWCTIVDYLQGVLNVDLSGERDDPFTLPHAVRQLVKDWEPAKRSPEITARRRLIEFMNGVVDPKKAYIYYFPADKSLGVPESFVDFTRLYTLLIGKAQELMPERKATLASPYREQFASKLGTYLSRIATPTPLRPPRM